MLAGKRCQFHVSKTGTACLDADCPTLHATMLTEPAFDNHDGNWCILVLVDGQKSPKSIDSAFLIITI